MNATRRCCENKPPSTRRGFTLVEVIMNLVVLAMVMGILSSAVLVASHAVPDDASPLQSTSNAYPAAERLASELYTAIAVTDHDARMIEFTVRDRDNDGQPETIRYEWSGTAGDSLRRTVNGGTDAPVAADVHEFELDYLIRETTTTVQVTNLVVGAEELVASFDSWTGAFLQTLTDNDVARTTWQATGFDLTPPANATALTFTRASMLLGRRGAAATATTYSIAIHPSASITLLSQPLGTPLGTPTTFASSAVPSVYQWTPLLFGSDVSTTDLSSTRYWLILKANGSNAIYAQGRNGTLAPGNGTFHRWSTDSGTSWLPLLTLLDQNELRFFLYGSYTTESTEDQSTVHRNLTGVSCRIQVGAEPSAAIETTVQILNEPTYFAFQVVIE